MENFLKSFQVLTEAEIDQFLKLGQHRVLKKDEFFIQEGQVCKKVGFVTSGLLRSFYYNSAGEEVTYCFTFSNDFVTAYSSFITQNTAAESIQALTDVELFILTREDITQLEESSLNWMKFSKMMAQQEYMTLEKRMFLLQKETAEHKYKDLLENYPDYLKLIPLNYLASYLGITQRHLSRIRKSYPA
ncbi:Crp/Fnr family transcriptional regulator [Siphonobacter sp. SORGH_AS_1065]|uniref:Crp/Fnr family transcriptional regulator n=1 Tax=Siphonobacter sp. SORGH_AS_1065 TaxID=3041795 RepID=UPI0027836470|nr:Crp/Fnr family transcriptional regulator [Siphonobacter sp. SORGH_AS_1065]MDQ1086091.1 CRP-like cAMP-binding protein [Siphonobacter sp. SORGH_AS_1065]